MSKITKEEMERLVIETMGGKVLVEIPSVKVFTRDDLGKEFWYDNSSIGSGIPNWKKYKLVYLRAGVAFLADIWEVIETPIIEGAMAFHMGRIEPVEWVKPKHELDIFKYESRSGRVIILEP